MTTESCGPDSGGPDSGGPDPRGPEDEAWEDRLREAARALPQEVAPERDLWPAIEARLAGSPFPRRRTPWRLPFGRTLALAAGLVLAVVFSTRAPDLRPGGGSAAPDAAALYAADAMQRAYEPGIRELEEALRLGRDRLQPETVETIERSLAEIDRAILEAREALDEDPANLAAQRALHGMYDARIRTLRIASRLLAGA